RSVTASYAPGLPSLRSTCTQRPPTTSMRASLPRTCCCTNTSDDTRAAFATAVRTPSAVVTPTVAPLLFPGEVAGFTTTGHRPAAHAAACDALDARNNRSVGTDTPA